MAKITKQIGTEELRPDSGFVAFIKKIDQKVNNMPSWKKGILEASSQSSNLSERPSVNILIDK